MKKTAFQNVADMNNLVGNTATGSLECARHQFHIIAEEVKELEDAILDEDLKMARDGVADVKVTVYGLAHRLGFKHFDAVVRGATQAFMNHVELQADETTAQFIRRGYAEMEIDTTLNWDLARVEFKSLIENFDDLSDALKTPFEIPPAVFYSASMIYCAETIAALLGFDSDADDAEVHRSNMSKFDTKEEDLRATIKKYYDIGVETVVRETVIDGVKYYVVKVGHDQNGKDGKFYRGGKFLKSVNFQEPNL